MNLKRLYLTKNDCYIAGEVFVPKGVMLHSTGANNPALKRYVGPDDGNLGANLYVNHWNQPEPDGQRKCAHAFIGKLVDGSVAAYQTLPWNMRGWHSGGSANDTHIGIEICEDALTDRRYFENVYREAAELTASICLLYGLMPAKDGVIIDHCEGYKRGAASDYDDVSHWFPRFEKSMDTFRADVRSILDGNGSEPIFTAMSLCVDNGEMKTATSIMKDGSNYPNLRELAPLLGYEVGYSPTTRVVSLDDL